jgi:hypothetical protein
LSGAPAIAKPGYGAGNCSTYIIAALSKTPLGFIADVPQCTLVGTTHQSSLKQSTLNQVFGLMMANPQYNNGDL